MNKNKSNKPSTSNSSAELFVLPPELLAKLGIDLSNIQHSNSKVQSPVTSLVKGSDQNIPNSSNSLPESRDESSIIETANLMKESVFLSPTFLQNASNVVLGEEVSIDNNRSEHTNDRIRFESGNILSSHDTDVTNISVCKENTPKLLSDNIITNSSPGPSEQQLDNMEFHESVKEYQVENKDGNLILTNVPFRYTEDIQISNDIPKKTIPVDEHPDEAYLSDCSINNLGCSPESYNIVINKNELSDRKAEKCGNVVKKTPQSKDVRDLISSSSTIFTTDAGHSVHSDLNITITDKLPEIIPTQRFIIDQTVVISGNSDTAENIQNTCPENTSENIISWTPVDQKDKEIQITKIDYDIYNNSIVNFNDSLNPENRSESAKIGFNNSESAQSLKNSEQVNKSIDCSINDTEKFSEEGDELLSVVQKKKELTVDNYNISNEKITVKNSEKNQKSILINTISENDIYKETNISETKSDSQDRVKEIAAYLSQIVNERKNIIENRNREKNRSKVTIDHKVVEKPSVKLIQEETIVCTRVLKTYQRTSTRKQIPALNPTSDKVMTSDSFQLSNNYDIGIQSSKVEVLSGGDKFCICYDFGSLAYYDCEMVYEHIHFWQHKNINCDSEILYSIYNDGYTVSKQINFIEAGHQNEHDDNKTSADNICWNGSILDNNGDLDDLQSISDSKIVEDTTSFCEQKTVMKAALKNRKTLPTSKIIEDIVDEGADNVAKKVRSRKETSDALNEVSEHIEPIAKKNIKCGVCYQLVSEVDWETHKETEHSSIAWNADQEIDLKNNSLLKTLSGRLKIDGFLKCPFCKTDLRKLIKFTQHIRKCIKQKEMKSGTTSVPSTPATSTRRSTRNSTNSEIDFPISPARKHFNSNVDDSPKPATVIASTRNSSNTILSVSKSSVDVSNKIEKSLSQKTKKAFRSENITTNEDIGGPSSKLVNDTPRPPTKKSTKIKSLSMDTSTKSTEHINELTEVLKVKEIIVSAKITTENIDSAKLAKGISVNIPMISSRSPRIEASTKSINSKDITDKEMNYETTIPTKKKTKIQNSTLDSSTNCSESNKFTKNTKPSEVAKAVDMSKSSNIESEIEFKLTKSSNIDTIKWDESLTQKSSNIKTVVPLSLSAKRAEHTKTSSTCSVSTPILTNNTNAKSMSPKQKSSTTKVCDSTNDTHMLVTTETETTNNQIEEQSLINKLNETVNETDLDASSASSVKSIDDPTNSTTTVSCNDKSLILSATSSGTSRKSSYIEITKSPKCTKRLSNTVPANTPVKKLKTTETDDHSTPTNRSSKITDFEIKKTLKPLEILKYTKNKESISNKRTKDNVNNTIGTNKSTKISISENVPHCDPAKSKRKYLNKKNLNTSQPNETDITDVQLPLKSTEPYSFSKSTLTPSPNIGTVDSTMELLTNTGTSTENTIIVIEIEAPSQKSDNLMKCGVCSKSVEDAQWIEHICKEHDYLAWRANEPSLDLEDKEAVKNHLQIISKQNEGLTCSKCGLVRKFAKTFIRHINSCNGNEKDTSNISTVSVDLNSTREHEDDSPLSMMKNKKSRSQRKSEVLPPVICGVCSQTVEQASWIEHIRVKHKYLAWVDGETPVNLNDEAEVKSHLNYISKHYGGLLCSKCGTKWNYVKKYLLHEQLCENGSPLNKLLKSTRKDDKIEVEISPIVTCGLCKMDVAGKDWLNHIQHAHQYLAWVDGEEPFDVDNLEQTKNHLTKVLKMAGELICMKCGVPRKYVHAYLQHIEACEKTGFNMQITEPVALDKDDFECGVCHKRGKRREWKDHAMTKHYNVAWMVGELPINVRNPYAVEKYLKEYQHKYSLICKHCKASRASCYGFYAHILTCGKSDEELEAVHNICDICNNKYLCVYRNQHIAMHRDQEYRREMKEMKVKKIAEEAEKQPEPQDNQPTRKRKAAQKAKKVIEIYSSNVIDGKLVCSCGTSFENAEEKSQHTCDQSQRNDDDESDVSVKIEPGSEVESVDTEVDSNVSEDEEEEQAKKKKRQRTGEGSTKITRMAYRVDNYAAYLVQSFKDFSMLHYTSESLFNEWRDSEYRVVPSDEIAKYLPPLTESCKVRFGNTSAWTTYKRFEAKKLKGYSIFTGGAIQCMAWAPHNIADETLGNYLAVSTHLGADVPRHGADEKPEHPGLIQIWDFSQFNFLPRCALGLAHEYGIVWALDWCPSGGRDRIPSDWNEDAISSFRLGLLAIACSNGTAYILAVPYPSQSENEPVLHKLKPVAELRLSMMSERRVYQATSIHWSQQKGHNIIIVGYSDGTTALYDLNTESPFLKEIENKVTIYYPFQDKRAENSSITGVGICPTANESYTIGGLCSASITGGTMSGWPSAGPSVRCHLAISAAYYSAQWPAVMLSGDAPFTVKSVNEMEWWGGGRRLGSVRGGAACARCGRVCAAAAPAVRLLRAHPCYPEIKKLIVATLLMVPIGQKWKRKVNDELSMVVEPLTYEDAVEKYGLQLDLVQKNEQVAAQKLCNENELCPERFPLSEIIAAAFCPSTRFHEKLALATHAGIIFVITA